MATQTTSEKRLLELYRAILLPRMIEEKMLNLLRQGRLSKWFSGIGQEAIAVGVASALNDDDFILPMHRNLGVFTTRGFDLEKLFRQLFGKDGGWTKGRDRTFHFGALDHRIVGMISHLGAMLPVADGLALAAQLRGEKRVAATFTGDGSTSEGDFHEAINLAAVWKLPVLFIVENNQYGLSTPVSEQYACENIADKAIGYGIPGVIVDGNDLLAVVDAVSAAATRARSGDGPTLLEFKTFRMRGHEEASGTAYVPKELFTLWAKKDPVARFEAALLEQKVVSPSKIESLRSTMKAMIDDVADRALAAPDPDSSAGAELRDVFAPSGVVVHDPSGPSKEMRLVDAVRDGLHEAMADPRVILMGQDIAEYGGVFKCTEGFAEEFGKARVRNTPIIESGAVGCAMGLALDGFRPMLEMQFGDFITCGFNQIVNNLAKTHYRWGAPLPVVLRVPVGGGMGAGPFHSQNMEAWFTHTAGLKVIEPATPYDAKGLLLAAFEDGNPVLFLEHKGLYRSAKGQVPEGRYTLPIGKARIARAGTDATIVTYGAGVVWALEAAEKLATEGFEVEVVDLRTLIPWDVEAAAASVRKTSKALVLHEAPVTGGFGAEIAATIAKECFQHLDAPVERLGGLDIPVPFSKKLEELFMPRARLLDTLRTLLTS
ncbi:MAG TPA: dehydrogenase E1 component subunit alpha/beta [Candidatus Polarisedimenticolaceae bacterium]|nr:dehydrogenase E1 component subunit alpha/beta [Candidatus Polarisedimenticolaceae bacterium]